MVSIRKPKNALKFSTPASWWASTWREGLFSGNGISGISVLGGACSDTLMITHAHLWWQGYVGVLQDVSDKIKDVRKKIEDNDIREAQKILANSLISKGYRPKPAFPMPVCDLNIDMPTNRPVKEYARILNMENGEVTVSYKDSTTRFERSAFVSRSHDIICLQISKAGQKTIDATFSFSLHDSFGGKNIVTLPDGVNIKYENYFMYFSARSDNGTEFGSVALINHFGGTQTVSQNSITISGAEKILILIKPFVESQREKEWKNGKAFFVNYKITL